MRGVYAVTAMVLAAVAAGCAAGPAPRTESAAAVAEREHQTELLVRAYIAEWERFRRVTFPLMVANAAACRQLGRSGYGLGLPLYNMYSWPAHQRAAATRAFAVGERPQMLNVGPGTPASRAGVQAGDVIIAYDGHEIPPGPAAIDRFNAVADIAKKRGGPAPLVVEREGDRVPLTIEPVELCDYGFVLIDSQAVNAAADGSRFGVTRGLLRFVESDDELAFVISHELAHNLRRHVDARRARAAVGSLVDILAGALGLPTGGVFREAAANIGSVDEELEADLVGIGLMKNAGFNVDAAPALIRRMALHNPRSIQGGFLASHPATPDRVVALERAAREIKAGTAPAISAQK